MVHGFDEFFGNRYHLNAEEEPENEDYPKNPEFLKKYGPRGLLHSWSNGDGTQRIENAGPLNTKRMETIDQEFSQTAMSFISKAKKDGKPFFVRGLSSWMHNMAWKEKWKSDVLVFSVGYFLISE